MRFDLNFEDRGGDNVALGPEQLLSCMSRTCEVARGRQSKAEKSTEAGFHRLQERTGALLQKQ